MTERSESEDSASSLRDKIIGLGERSLRKSYYPQLRQQLEATEKSRSDLEEKSAALQNMLEDLEAARSGLAESEARFRALVENINDVIVSLDTRGTITYISPVVRNFGGPAPEQCLDKSFTDFVHPDDRSAVMASFDGVLAGRQEPQEFRFMNKDGGSRHVRMSSRPLVEDGRVVGLTGVIGDITERKAAEDELRKLNNDFVILLENSGDFIYFKDRNNRFLFCSQTLANITGHRSWRDMIGKDDFEVFPEEAARIYREEELPIFIEGRALLNKIDPYFDARGERRWVNTNKWPVFDDNGAVVGIFGISRDVTELKAAQEQLTELNRELERRVSERTVQLEAANQAKSTFLANMSHELRTPLNAILGFSSMMRRNPQLSENQAESLDIINRSGEHLLALINDVLEMAKIEAGRVKLEIAPFDLGGMVRDLADMMQLRAKEKGLQLLVDQSSEFPRHIRGDEARLRQILVNLVGNAIKFTKEGGVTIRLGLKQNRRQHLLIEVEDTGPGIGAEDQQRIFQPFVQLVEGAEQKGTGLGLTITRQFVELMGGTIAVESSLGKGSLFRVELPVELVGAADIPAAIREEAREVLGLAPGQPAYRILIAEDQPDNQMLLTQLMNGLGLETKVAENGEQCVQLFQDWRPDLIWMDRRMPVMDGTEATRRIRQLPGGEAVKIVAVTASAFKEQQQEMLAAGMDDFVSKPYRFGEIYDSLSRQLGLKYIYRADASKAQVAPVALTPAMMAGLPAALRQELREALERLDSERIAALIEQVAAIDAQLGSALYQLADRFDYGSMLRILHETNS